MGFKITGLDTFQREIDQMAEAVKALDGELVTLNFDPHDQTSIENAIAETRGSIDRKIVPYRGNPIVENIVSELKEKYEKEILDRAAEARSSNGGEEMPTEKIDQSIFRQIENTVSDLRRADYNTFDRHIKKLSRLIHSENLKAITSRLAAQVDLDAWIKEGEATQGGLVGSATLAWPADTDHELGLVIRLIDRFAEQEDAAFNFSHTFYYNGSNVSSNIQSMVTQMIVPFARDYIDHVKSMTGATEATLLPTRTGPAARKVFIVHGHDEGAREAVARFLEKLDFQPIILHEQANQGRTIIEKIEAHGDVGFAVILLTPDDIGGLVGANPQPRARQNVLLELGFFIGRLGRSRVCALKRGDIEVPSDFGGVVYEPYDAGGGWKQALSRELQAAGFQVDWNAVMGR